MSPARTRASVVRVGDDRSLVFTMRDLNQQTARIMSEIEKQGLRALITKHGRFVAVIEALEQGQVARVVSEMAREVGDGAEPSGVEAGDDGALVFTMRDLNQQTARIMSEIEKRRLPAFITKHGRFVAVIQPLK